MTHRPIISDDPMYLLLKDRLVEEFNRRKAAGEPCALEGCDFSGMDLRDLDADGLDLTGACLDDADLRGLDLRGARLEGATLHGARIAGAYFPPEVPAAEIELSLQHGTRLRYRR
jgi:uncharacterized protein YjbI with pentapeptide repeats